MLCAVEFWSKFGVKVEYWISGVGQRASPNVESWRLRIFNTQLEKLQSWRLNDSTSDIQGWGLAQCLCCLLAKSNLGLAAKSNVEPLSGQSPNIESPESPILNQELQDWTSQIEFFFVQGWTSQIEFFKVQHVKNANSPIEFCAIMGFKVQPRRTILNTSSLKSRVQPWRAHFDFD